MLLAISLIWPLSCLAQTLPSDAPAVWTTRTLSPDDHRELGRAVQIALEKTVSQFVTRWRNAQSGVGGTVVPRRTFKTTAGFYCREFRLTIERGGGEESDDLAACRRSSGIWLPGAP